MLTTLNQMTEEKFSSHPFAYFIIMNIIVAAGILGIVFAVTCLGALPIYLLT